MGKRLEAAAKAYDKKKVYTVEEGEDVTFTGGHKVKKTANLNDVIEDENIIDGEVISEE